MKIIQVMPEFGLAGAEIMAENLIYNLQESGVDVIVVSFYEFHSPITERMKSKNIQIVYLNKKRGLDFSIISKLRALCQKERPNAIHTHRYVLPYVFLATIGLNIKIVHTVHNVAEKEVPLKQQKLQYLLFRNKRIIPVAITPLVKESIEKRYKIEKRKIPMVFNGIDLNNYYQKADYSLHNQGVILHVGRFTDQKNHRVLIKAFRKVIMQHPDCILKLIGDGELLDDIKKLCKEYSIQDNVIFMGLRDDISKQMVDSDIFVLPSNYEGMPITLIEAMATGLPIIATAVGGVPDMLTSMNGVLIENKCDDLAKAIELLLNSKEKRSKLGKKAIEDSIRFSSREMTKNYLNLYQ